MRVIRFIGSILFILALVATPTRAQWDFQSSAPHAITDGVPNNGDDIADAYAGCVADFDGDGDLDVAVGTTVHNKILWHSNQGDGTFDGFAIVTDSVDWPAELAAADLDGDDDPDLLSASAGDGKIAWYRNDGTGSFGYQLTLCDTASLAADVLAVDLDGDDDLDVVWAAENDASIAWRANDGSGNFAAPVVVSDSAHRVSSLAVADIDGDDDPDLVATRSSADHQFGGVVWYANRGDGTFDAERLVVEIGGYQEFAHVSAGDLDGDDDPDLLAWRVTGSWTTEDTLFWFPNLGGAFGARTAITRLPANGGDTRVVDLDGDGDGDVFANEAGAATYRVLGFANDGSGAFPVGGTTHNSTARALDFGDLDGDGDPDALVGLDGGVRWRETVLEYEWTGAASDDWSDYGNWETVSGSQGIPPTPLSDVAIKHSSVNHAVVRAPVEAVAVKSLFVYPHARLDLETQTTAFDVAGDVEIDGTLDAKGAPLFRVGGDWLDDPRFEGDEGFIPGTSTVELADSATLSGAFHNLAIDAERAFAADDIRVSGTLTLDADELVLGDDDTLTAASDASDAIMGGGVVAGGTIVRAFSVGSGATLRFESPLTVVAYDAGDEPTFYAMTTTFVDPDSLVPKPAPRETMSDTGWTIVPAAALDTATKTFTVADVAENGEWAFGFESPPVMLERVYVGEATRFEPIAKETDEQIASLTLRWSPKDLPDGFVGEPNWSELRCYVWGVPTGVKEENAETPARFALSQNYPNPFNPATTIRYALPEAATVRLTVFNALGETVRELESSAKQAGYHETTFNAADLGSGVYFYRIDAVGSSGERFQETRKALLVK